MIFFSFNSYVLDFGLEGGVLGLGLGLEVCVLGLALALGFMSLLTSLLVGGALEMLSLQLQLLLTRTEAFVGSGIEYLAMPRRSVI